MFKIPDYSPLLSVSENLCYL